MLSIVGSRCGSSVAGYPDTPPTTTASIIQPLLRSGRSSAEAPQQTTSTDTRQVVPTVSRFGSQTAVKNGEISNSAAATASSGAVGGALLPGMHLQARTAAASADAAIAAIAASAAGEAEEELPAAAQTAPAGGIAAAVTTTLAVRAAAADACPAKLTVLSVEASACCPVVWQNPLSLG